MSGHVPTKSFGGWPARAHAATILALRRFVVLCPPMPDHLVDPLLLPVMALGQRRAVVCAHRVPGYSSDLRSWVVVLQGPGKEGAQKGQLGVEGLPRGTGHCPAGQECVWDVGVKA